MYLSKTKLRTRYAETDQMGIVYYGNYPQFFEVGRVEALRQLGFSYKVMEDNGIMLPVLKLEVKYIKPALYDDELEIRTRIRTKPTVRICFEHEIYNEKGDLLTTGTVELVFVDKKKGKPCLAPPNFLKALEAYF